MDHCMSLVTAKAAGSRDNAFMSDGKTTIASIYHSRLNH